MIPRVALLIKQNKDEEIQKLYNSTLATVMLMVVPAIVGLFSLSEDIVLLIAGKDYIEAAEPLSILAFSLFFATVACLYVNGILIPYRRERTALILTVVSAVINIGLNIILIPKIWNHVNMEFYASFCQSEKNL